MTEQPGDVAARFLEHVSSKAPQKAFDVELESWLRKPVFQSLLAKLVYLFSTSGECTRELLFRSGSVSRSSIDENLYFFKKHGLVTAQRFKSGSVGGRPIRYVPGPMWAEKYDTIIVVMKRHMEKDNDDD